MAWDSQNTDSSTTSNILVGSDDGHIYETVLEAKDKKLIEHKAKQVCCDLKRI